MTLDHCEDENGGAPPHFRAWPLIHSTLRALRLGVRRCCGAVI